MIAFDAAHAGLAGGERYLASFMGVRVGLGASDGESQ